MNAQTKVISNTELLPGSGIFFQATMDQPSSSITITIQGPDDRWFGIGFGTGMIGGDALIFTDGRQGAMHALGVWDYDLNAQQTSGVDKDNTQNWTVQSNTASVGVRTIVATRLLNDGDPIDDILSYNDAALNLIWANGVLPGNTMSYHSSNRGVNVLPWALGDTVPPALSDPAFAPEDNSIDVGLNTNLTLNFNEIVLAGIGNVSLFETVGNVLVETFDVANNASITGNAVSFDPVITLNSNTSYYILADSGAIIDLSGNAFAGIISDTVWNFTTVDLSGDTIAPQLLPSSFLPLDNALNVPVNSGLSVTFDEEIVIGIGAVRIIKSSDNSVVETIDVSNPNLSVSGNQLSLSLSSPLSYFTAYHVEMDQGIVSDLAGNGFAGIEADTTWNFKTHIDSNDQTPPTLALSPFDPQDNAINVFLNTNLTVTFTEDIAPGAGLIHLRNASNNALVQTFDAATNDVSVSGNQLLMNPANDLGTNSNYYIVIPQGAVTDLGGNPYAGFVNSSIWNFSTGNLVEIPEYSDEINVFYNGSDAIVINKNDNRVFEYVLWDMYGRRIKEGVVSNETIISTQHINASVIMVGITHQSNSYVFNIPIFSE